MHTAFVIFIGWTVSFLGQLPLGTMSITSTQIAVEENFTNAWRYTFGVAIVEIIYLRITLSGVDWIMQHPVFYKTLGWLTVVFFVALAILSFVSVKKDAPEKKTMLLNNKLDRFILGLTMSALNPAQIAFWFVWSSYLLSINVLYSGTTEFNLFTLGCGSGTIAGLALYIYGGNWLVTKMGTSNKTLNLIIGVIFVIAALAQLYRMIFMP